MEWFGQVVVGIGFEFIDVFGLGIVCGEDQYWSCEFQFMLFLEYFQVGMFGQVEVEDDQVVGFVGVLYCCVVVVGQLVYCVVLVGQVGYQFVGQGNVIFNQQ